MARRLRRDADRAEGESYYISMTDMMIGVVFIFIIMLGYFGSQFHATTRDLLRQDDPKTAVLLQKATNLESSVETVQVDRAQKVVCLSTRFLQVEAETGQEGSGQRCFSYAAPTKTKAEQITTSKVQERAELTELLRLQAQEVTQAVEARPQEGNLIFDADVVFAPGTDQITSEGQVIADRVAASLWATLPCYGYLENFDTRRCENGDARIAVVNVLAATDLDPFSPEGQAASALALRRSVAFHRALTTAQPNLTQLRDRPPSFGQETQPLLRVASIAQSEEGQGARGLGKTIRIQIDMVW